MRQQSKIRSFDNMVMYYFQQTRPECKIEKFYTTDRQNKSDCFSVDGFFLYFNTVFDEMCCFYHFVSIKKYVHLYLKKIFNTVVRKESSLSWEEVTHKKKVSLSLICGGVSGGDCTKQTLMLNYISVKISRTSHHLQNTNS